MASTSIVPLQAVEVYLHKPYSKHAFFKSNVYDIKGDHLMIYPPNAEGEVLKFSRVEGPVTLTIYTKAFLLKYNVAWVKDLSEDKIMINVIKLIGEPQKIQRRSYFRIEKTVPASYSVHVAMVATNGDQVEVGELELSEITFEGETKDISASGTRAFGNHELKSGAEVQVSLTLNEKQVGVTGYVVDCTPNVKTHAYRFTYRIRFTEIAAKAKDAIIDYVWHAQQNKQEKRPLPVNKEGNKPLPTSTEKAIPLSVGRGKERAQNMLHKYVRRT